MRFHGSFEGSLTGPQALACLSIKLLNPESSMTNPVLREYSHFNNSMTTNNKMHKYFSEVSTSTVLTSHHGLVLVQRGEGRCIMYNV